MTLSLGRPKEAKEQGGQHVPIRLYQYFSAFHTGLDGND